MEAGGKPPNHLCHFSNNPLQSLFSQKCLLSPVPNPTRLPPPIRLHPPGRRLTHALAFVPSNPPPSPCIQAPPPPPPPSPRHHLLLPWRPGASPSCTQSHSSPPPILLRPLGRRLTHALASAPSNPPPPPASKPRASSSFPLSPPPPPLAPGCSASSSPPTGRPLQSASVPHVSFPLHHLSRPARPPPRPGHTTRCTGVPRRAPMAGKPSTTLQGRCYHSLPGYSWIEVMKEVHTFSTRGREHPQAEVIYSVLDELTSYFKILDISLIPLNFFLLV